MKLIIIIGWIKLDLDLFYFGLSLPKARSTVFWLWWSIKLPKKYLFTELYPSFNDPANVRFPVLVKSVFKAGVPEYWILSESALFVHTSLNLYYSPYGSL